MDCIITAHGKIAEDSVYQSPILGLQLKAKMMDPPTGEKFSFSLKIKNYDDLREPRTYPTLLVVLAMPHDKAKWLIHSQNSLITRDCAYWCNLNNAPSITNSASRVVHVPTANHFSRESLTDIMHKASKFERMGNDF